MPTSALRKRPTRTTVSRKRRSCVLPRPGRKCPRCRKGKLDYDGLLNLVCPQCGHVALAGSFS